MSNRRVTIAAKPVVDPSAHAWVREGAGADANALPKAERYGARLTVDVSVELRARIKVLAFQRGVTVADMLRELLEHEYGEGKPG